MQKLIIAGNVGKDAELRRLGNGDPVLNFSVAVDQGKDASGNKRDTLWVDCSVWGKRAESLQNYITKGTKLTLEGRPTVRAHDGKAYLGMSVNDLTFQGGGSDDRSNNNGGGSSDRDQGGYGNSGGGSGYGAGGSPNSGRADMDDSIPFAAEWRV
jgi:single-strand DNA-binding protein